MIQLNKISIIYPETKELEALAKTLASRMEHFRIPGDVRSRTNIGHLKEVNEPWLIVLCTPDTPKDPKITEHLCRFTEQGLYHHILTLLVDGDPDESFPELLLKELRPDGTIVYHEPLAANIVASSPRERIKKLKVEKLRLLAPILGVSFDDLMNRRRKQRLRILTAASCVVLAGGAAFSGVSIHRASVFAGQQKDLTAQYDKTREARDRAEQEEINSRNAFASAIGVEASELLKKNDTELAMLLCLEFLPEYKELPELREALEKGLKMRLNAGYVPVTAKEEDLRASEDSPERYTFAQFKEAAGREDFDWYVEEEGYILTFLGDSALLYKADPLEYLFSFENDFTKEIQSYVFDILSLPSGQKYLIHGDYIYDISTGEFVKKLALSYGVTRLSDCTSSEGYILCKRGTSELFVIDIMKEKIIASLDAPFYPVTKAAFSGDYDPSSKTYSASSLLVNGIEFVFRDASEEVPSSLEEQISLARTTLGERELTEEERLLYSLQDAS